MSYLKKQPIETRESGMPHIYWNNGFTTNPNKNDPVNDSNRMLKATFPNLTKEQIRAEKIKEWAFYILVGIVIVSCVIIVGKELIGNILRGLF